MIITASQIARWKDCRRRFWFEYVEMLKPVVSDEALETGRQYHQLLECFFKSGEVPDPDDNSLPAEMVRAFLEKVPYTFWEPIDVEKEFHVRISRGVWLEGKIDLSVNVGGNRMIVDHKTARIVDENYLHHLLWDDQASAYILASRLDGNPLDGMLYAICQKPTIRQKMTETPEEYAERVAQWYNEDKRFTIHFVYRTAAQLAAKHDEFVKVASDIRACKRSGRYYPNPNACRILACPYASICLEDTPECRDGNFVFKPKANEELSF